MRKIFFILLLFPLLTFAQLPGFKGMQPNVTTYNLAITILGKNNIEYFCSSKADTIMARNVQYLNHRWNKLSLIFDNDTILSELMFEDKPQHKDTFINVSKTLVNSFANVNLSMHEEKDNYTTLECNDTIYHLNYQRDRNILSLQIFKLRILDAPPHDAFQIQAPPPF